MSRWFRSYSFAEVYDRLAVREGLEIEDALEYVQRRKRSADPLPHQLRDLQAWWDARN